MSDFNKSYRIRTEVGKDTEVHVNLKRDYDVLELMSLKINQENIYKFHTANYGVVAGRVLANDAFGIPNAKVSVFIPIDKNDQMDVVKSVLYPYNNTKSQDNNGVRYNLLPNEQISECYTVIGTFPEKQYLLDNNNVLEVFEKYYKFTTRTNNAGDYMIFGLPTGSQTIHVDIDLSDIGILSQKPRDMVYKGYNIESFENPNKFKSDTNIDSLVQVISQDSIADVIPFWGEESESTVGITRCDINIQYKFEPTCVFMGSVVSDTNSNGISKKCIPTPGMGSMEEIVTGSGTIEMIRKTPGGSVEEFQIKGNQLINGNGVWCYQIPMNLDYMMTDEYGNMVPTNHPDKGVPTRTRVRFRISMQDFENDNENLARGKMLVPHNPNIYNGVIASDSELDYNFGTKTKEESYRDLFWNGVYTVKSYIPRIQKGANWKNEKFTGFKRVNYYGDNNPIPYNNIRIKIPFAFTMMCVLIKSMIRSAAFLNWLFRLCSVSFVGIKDEDGYLKSGSFLSISGEICNDNLDYLCIIPGINIVNIVDKGGERRKSLLAGAILKHAEELGGDLHEISDWVDGSSSYQDSKSIDSNNREDIAQKGEDTGNSLSEGERTEEAVEVTDGGGSKKSGKKYNVTVRGIRVTDKVDYFLQCIEMKLAQEFKVIQFDFYNDWINGVIYIPRWMRIITKKHNYLWGLIKFGGKVKACNENTSRKINIVQQCGLTYSNKTSENMQIVNPIGCKKTKSNEKLYCHKSNKVRKTYRIFKTSGLVHSFKNMNEQYIYYFKPIDNGNRDKCIRLFATDIVMLGTLNNCDIWGIPGNLAELVPSTYQMPPNLALTDSDLEGNDYESKVNSGKAISFTLRVDKGKATSFNLGDCYVGINPLEEDANYTEISGIDWGYAGPLQTINVPNVSASKLYKPGGHFLGITCRNAETNIKTCVNLSRICEYGVWMSQRQELNIPNPDTPEYESEAFLNYATVPTGFISKDEISDTNYRRIFASLNKNKLRTRINPGTGYPIYDFEYVNPTNFGGELKNRLMSSTNDSKYMNRKVTELSEEHYYTYSDDDYYYRDSKQVESIPNETEIMRTGEFSDSEYLKYRFGLSDVDFQNGIVKTESRKYRFLLKDNDGNLSFPMFENSFYFYFGLKNGNTALDEFKKTYYANCGKIDLFNEDNSNINLIGLTTEYDGWSTTGVGSGSISFTKISANKEAFADGLDIELWDDNDNQINGFTVPVEFFDRSHTFNNLTAGDYKIKIRPSNSKENEKVFPVNVGRIHFKLTANSVGFKKDVSTWDNKTKFNDYDKRDELGGYLVIKDNLIEYVKSDTDTISYDIFNDNVITNYTIECIDEEGLISGQGTTVEYKRIKKELQTDADGNYMIPVPSENKKYVIKIYALFSYTTNKIDETGNGGIQSGNRLVFTTPELRVNNGTVFDFYYNDVSFKDEIMPYITSYGSNINADSTSGWWDVEASKESGRLQWDVENGDITRWNIKKSLYMSNIENENKPHIIKIHNYGGNAPYTVSLKGEKEDMSTTFEADNVSALERITVPTINFHKNGLRRANFSYSVSDAIGQKLPNGGEFVFPVIYKPFFMEMLLCNYEEHGVYICGNVYNGCTWTESEGFNYIMFNNQILSPITTTKPDTLFELNEIDSNGKTHIGGGLSYTGTLQKYNGRKIHVTRRLTSLDLLGLTTNGDGMLFDLTIGTSHEEDGTLYEDTTSCKADNISLYAFKLKANFTNKSYKFNMELLSNDKEKNYKLYSIINDDSFDESGKIKTGCYPYPFGTNGSPLFENSLLFRHIMDGKLKSLFDGDGSNTTQEIEINNNSTLGNRNVYYIAVPTNVNIVNTTNSNSIIKSVSISKLIQVDTLTNFYPLVLKPIPDNCVDILNQDGTFKTTIMLKGDDEKSIENIGGKSFNLRVFRDKSDLTPVYEITLVPNSDKRIIWELTNDERTKIGLTHNENNNSGDVTKLYIDYEATIINSKITSPSFYNKIEVPVKFNNQKKES
jgi:hypothetical protein